MARASAARAAARMAAAECEAARADLMPAARRTAAPMPIAMMAHRGDSAMGQDHAADADKNSRPHLAAKMVPVLASAAVRVKVAVGSDRADLHKVRGASSVAAGKDRRADILHSPPHRLLAGVADLMAMVLDSDRVRTGREVATLARLPGCVGVAAPAEKALGSAQARAAVTSDRSPACAAAVDQTAVDAGSARAHAADAAVTSDRPRVCKVAVDAAARVGQIARRWLTASAGRAMAVTAPAPE